MRYTTETLGRHRSPKDAKLYEWTLECPVCGEDITFYFTMFSSYDDYSGATEGDSEWVDIKRTCTCDIEEFKYDDDALYWMYVSATEQWAENDMARWYATKEGKEFLDG